MQHPSHLLQELQQRARKRFGQHFLASDAVVHRIVRLADVGPGSRVLEVGPGLGVLTESLLLAGATVRAVELDRDLAQFLRERLPAVDLVEGDILAQDLDVLLDGGPWRVVANLPYNVGTQAVLRLVAAHPRVDRLVVMLQKEVAERIVAQPGSKAYGSLSVAVAVRGQARVGLLVPPGSFHPPPKVDSAVIEIRLSEPAPVVARNPRHFERVVRAAFSARRKVVSNALSSAWPKDRVFESLASVGIDPRRRAEEIPVAGFLALAEALE